MTEVNASSDQTQEVGAVLGQILHHALDGHCFISQSLPEESFFLDYLMARLGSENFTVEGNHRNIFTILHVPFMSSDHIVKKYYKHMDQGAVFLYFFL